MTITRDVIFFHVTYLLLVLFYLLPNEPNNLLQELTKQRKTPYLFSAVNSDESKVLNYFFLRMLRAVRDDKIKLRYADPLSNLYNRGIVGKRIALAPVCPFIHSA